MSEYKNVSQRIINPEGFARELPPKTVIKMRKGKHEAFAISFEQALEIITNSGGYHNPQNALEFSSPENPLSAGNYYLWLNPEKTKKPV